MFSTATKILIARMLYFLLHALRRPFGFTDQAVARRRGVVWNLDLREGIDLTIYALGAFEWNTLRALESRVREGATVLDVGANVGAHTLHLARLVGPKGLVIAFEPTDFAMAKLRANLAANPDLASRVEVHQAFLVEDEKAALVPTLASSWPVDGTPTDDPQMGSRAMNLSGATATTLDSVFAAAGNPEVQLIKMDVDGHELEVLKGARRLLERSRPIIVMELAPYVFHPAEKFDDLVALLTSLRYQFLPLGSSSPLPDNGPALRARIPREGSVNVVAVPKALG
ncbi:MAG: FkbM family methyltransferase [Vicinamibacteria bacterium]